MKWTTKRLVPLSLLFLSISAEFDDYEFYDAGTQKLIIRKPPPYLKTCRRSDKKINYCIKSSLNDLIPHLSKGSKELGLPSIDPLLVPLIQISEGSGNVSLDLVLRDLQILGLQEINIVNIRSNLEDKKFEITMKSPYLDIVGQFTGEGGVLSFPIVGHGDFYFNLTDVSAAWILYLAQSDPVHGHSYYMVDQMLLDIIPADIAARFGEAVDDDNRLGTAFNQFFNENAHEIFKTVKPKISEALSNVLGSLATKVLSRFPAEVLLPP